MKKFIILITLVSSITILTACSDEEVKPVNETTVPGRMPTDNGQI